MKLGASTACFYPLETEKALLKVTELNKNKVYKVNAKVEKRDESYQLIVYGMFQI